MRIRHLSLWAAVLVATAVPTLEAAAPPPQSAKRVASADVKCSRAVSDSRMVCLTGANCQREISPILRTCDAQANASCAAAREEMKTHCSGQAPWYGSRDCDSALQQVSHYCGRQP